jgi:ABC-2 type transport system ATP-binding protein
VIELHEVSKSFGAQRVLDRLSMCVGQGEIYGLLGPNGSGKSTAIGLVCGSLQPDGGRIAVGGREGAAAGADWFGVVAQEPALYPDLSVRQQLDFFARLYGLDRARRRERIARLLEQFELAPYADLAAERLSGGWRRRLHIAIGMVHAPRLLILDEPTASVDLAARHALWQVIRDQRAAGTGVLLTTHHLDEAEQLCDRIGILHQGRLLVEGTRAQILATVPAAQIALLDADRLPPLRERADALGLASREVGGRLDVLLPQVQSLADTVRQFDGLGLRSLALSPVNLEHAYLHLLGAVAAVSSSCDDVPDRSRAARDLHPCGRDARAPA